MERAIGYGRAGRTVQASLADSPPRWAVVTVKCCVVGILVLPLCAPVLLLLGSSLLGPQAEGFRLVASAALIALWAAMLTCAEVLTGYYPPARR